MYHFTINAACWEAPFVSQCFPYEGWGIMQSDPVNMDTEGHRKCLYQQGFRIKCVEFRENVRPFFPQGQSKRSVMTRCLY